MEQNPQNALWYVNKKTTSIRQEVINLRLGMILAAQLPHDTLTSFMTSNTLRFIISDLCQFPYNVRHDKVSQPSAWRAQYHSSIFIILASCTFFLHLWCMWKFTLSIQTTVPITHTWPAHLFSWARIGTNFTTQVSSIEFSSQTYPVFPVPRIYPHSTNWAGKLQSVINYSWRICILNITDIENIKYQITTHRFDELHVQYRSDVR